MVSLAEPYHLLSRYRADGQDFALYQDHPASLIDLHMADPFSAAFPRTSHEVMNDAIVATSSSSSSSSSASSSVSSSTAFVDPSLYSEQNYLFNGRSSPCYFPQGSDDASSRPPCPSDLSTASATSSAIGSPLSNPGGYLNHPDQLSSEWPGLGLNPGIVSASHPTATADYITAAAVSVADYSPFSSTTIDDITSFDFYHPVKVDPGFVDPNHIHHPELGQPQPQLLPFENPAFKPPAQSYPVPSSLPTSPMAQQSTINTRRDSQSPFLQSAPFQHYSPFPPSLELPKRQPSIGHYVPQSPPALSTGTADGSCSGDDAKDKPRCTYPDCGRVFKDLKSHMLTHQTERPEKCPIQNCEYHIKGFARRYDKNRHTLTHYKGTMVCGFCPGSGSSAEKSFNRADVFKRHLTAVHGVEQAPPNSRKRTSAGNLISTSGAASGSSSSGSGTGSGTATPKKLPGYPPDATGKCSTCTQTFANAQEFYEHLDECVLRIVQQEDPAEAINAQCLAEVEHDEDVVRTLEKNHLPVITTTAATNEGNEDDMSEVKDEDADMDVDAADDEGTGSTSSSPSSLSKHHLSLSKKQKTGPAGGVQKSRGLTHSRGGVPLASRKNRGRKSRSDYPSSWGFDKGQMKMKKRVVTVFDGPRRLTKDDMLLSTEHEVRFHLADGKSYVTDLDVLTLRRTDALLNATEDEKGPWISDDPTEEDVARMREMHGMLQRGGGIDTLQ